MWKMTTPRFLAALFVALVLCALITTALVVSATAGIDSYISILASEEESKVNRARKDYESNIRQLEEAYQKERMSGASREERMSEAEYNDRRNAEKKRVRDAEDESLNRELELRFLQRKLILLAYSFVGMFVLLNSIELFLNFDKEILNISWWPYHNAKPPNDSFNPSTR